jgi:hypothetical protein
MLEVFKKLTESGWIVKGPEFKQIIDFVEITVSQLVQDPSLKDFIAEFMKHLGCSENVN